MRTLLSDTDPEAERAQIEMLRAAPEWRRAELMFDMIETVRALVLAGVRERYPHAEAAEVRRRVAGVLLGEELAEKAYGPLASGEEASA